MPPSEVLAEKPWSYVLFREDERVLLTFMMGGSVESDWTIPLEDDEFRQATQGEAHIEKLIALYRNNPGLRTARALPVPKWPNSA
jgi:hypothetical protein